MASFTVDTKGKCFLCLKIVKKPFKIHEENEDDEDQREEEEEEEGVEFNFQRVHHFLKLSPKKVLGEFKQTAVLSSQALKSKNFSVLLCDDCVTVAGRISDLCEELESIQMLLEYSIREMGEIIRTSDEAGSNDGSLTIPKIAVLLRKHTKQHCKSAIQRIPTAKIKLHLIDEGEDEELQLEEEEESNDDLPDPEDQDPCQYLGGDIQELKQHNEDEDYSINGDFRFSRLEFERSAEVSEFPYVCPFCSSKFILVDALRQHTVNNHLHLLFYSAKLPHISNVEFKSCCEKLLKDQTNASSIPGGFQCSQCNVVIKFMKQFHHHLFLLHFDALLLPELAVIQDEYHDNQPSILKQALMSTASKPGTQFSCSFCSRIFPTSWKLKLHSSSFHLDQFLSAAKLEHISDEKFHAICTILYEKETDSKSKGGRRVHCSHCSSGYSDRRILMLHLLDTHYNILVEKLDDLQKNPSRTKLLTPGPSSQKYFCKPCDIEFNNLLMYKRHKVKVHPEQATYTCASCGLKLLTQIEWIKHRTLYCHMRKNKSTTEKPPVIKSQFVNGGGRDGGDKRDFNEEEPEETTHQAVQEILLKLRNSKCDSNNRMLCPICAQNNGVTLFNDSRQLVRHVIRFHTEHFFMSLKKPDMHITTFSGFCNQLFGEDKFPPVTRDAASGILIYKCPFCFAMFNDRRSTQRHQIQVHYSQLCDELEKLMQESERASAKPINAPPATSEAFGAAAAQVLKGFVPISPRPQGQGIHLPPSRRGYKKCPRCQKVFSGTTNMQRHMTSLACREGTSAPRPVRRITTMDNLPPGGRVFPCQYCGTLLSSNANRNRHIRRHCPQAKEAGSQPNYVANSTESGDSELVNFNWEDGNEDSYVLSYEDDEASMDYKEEPEDIPIDEEPGSSSSFALYSGSHVEDEEEGVGQEMGSVQEDMNFVNMGQLGQNEDDGIQLDELSYEDPLGM